MEFIAEYWFLAIVILLFAAILWRSSIKFSEGQNKLMSVLFAFVIFVPPWFLSGDNYLFSSVYLMSVGVIFIVAYYKTNLCMLFKGLEGVCLYMFFPSSKNWLLIIGYVLLAASIIRAL